MELRKFDLVEPRFYLAEARKLLKTVTMGAGGSHSPRLVPTEILFFHVFDVLTIQHSEQRSPPGQGFTSECGPQECTQEGGGVEGLGRTPLLGQG